MGRLITCVVFVSCVFNSAASAQRTVTREPPCGEFMTQAEANACSRREYEKADAEMNHVYRQLMSELGGGSDKDQQKLRRAQVLWLQYRDANCESEASIYEGGTIRPAVYNLCLASMTRERAMRMKTFLAEVKM
jgi:uncharacterized protein YecT (DUF1311 family)